MHEFYPCQNAAGALHDGVAPPVVCWKEILLVIHVSKLLLIPSQLTPVQGTASVHQILSKGDGKLKLKKLSCFCTWLDLAVAMELLKPVFLLQQLRQQIVLWRKLSANRILWLLFLVLNYFNIYLCKIGPHERTHSTRPPGAKTVASNHYPHIPIQLFWAYIWMLNLN